MQKPETVTQPFQTSLKLRPEPPPRRFEPQTQPAISAARLRRLALLVF